MPQAVLCGSPHGQVTRNGPRHTRRPVLRGTLTGWRGSARRPRWRRCDRALTHGEPPRMPPDPRPSPALPRLQHGGNGSGSRSAQRWVRVTFWSPGWSLRSDRLGSREALVPSRGRGRQRGPQMGVGVSCLCPGRLPLTPSVRPAPGPARRGYCRTRAWGVEHDETELAFDRERGSCLEVPRQGDRRPDLALSSGPKVLARLAGFSTGSPWTAPCTWKGRGFSSRPALWFPAGSGCGVPGPLRRFGSGSGSR